MKKVLKTMGVAAAIAATSLGFVQSAEARDHWHRGGGNDAAIAIGAGVLGLAVGAAIADRGDGRYYDRRYYGERRYVTVRNRPGYYYYYEGQPRRYYYDRYYGRPNYYGGSYGGRWDRGWDRGRHGGWDRGRHGGWDHDRGYDHHHDRGYGRRGY